MLLCRPSEAHFTRFPVRFGFTKNPMPLCSRHARSLCRFRRPASPPITRQERQRMIEEDSGPSGVLVFKLHNAKNLISVNYCSIAILSLF